MEEGKGVGQRLDGSRVQTASDTKSCSSFRASREEQNKRDEGVELEDI